MARSVGLTRERVVSVAAELADTRGLDQLALARVAARLGVRIPSLYNHVDGLAGLRRELALLGVRRLTDQLSRAAIGRAGDEAVVAIAGAYRAFVLAHPGLYAATIHAPDPDDAELHAASRATIEVVVAVLAHFRLGDEGTIHAVRGLRALVHGFATLEAAGGFGLPLDRDESFARLVRAFIAGLHTNP